MVWKLAAAGSTCEDKDEVAPDNKDEELVASEVAAYLSFILAPAAVRKWPSCTAIAIDGLRQVTKIQIKMWPQTLDSNGSATTADGVTSSNRWQTGLLTIRTQACFRPPFLSLYDHGRST